MKKKGKIVAVILARGGSKSIPGKNIRSLAGKPLIAYAIEAALKSKLLDRVIVSTDNEEIANIARKYGAEVPFMRPAELATDTAHTPPVIEHAISWLETNENYPVYAAVTLQPTSPLRTAEHIDEGIKKFLGRDCNSLISLTNAFPPYWMFKADETDKSKLAPLIYFGKENPFNLERQQFPKVYQPNGALYITRRDYLKKEGAIVDQKNTEYMLMDEKSSLDIDSEVDFRLVEEILKERREGK